MKIRSCVLLGEMNRPWRGEGGTRGYLNTHINDFMLEFSSRELICSTITGFARVITNCIRIRIYGYVCMSVLKGTKCRIVPRFHAFWFISSLSMYFLYLSTFKKPKMENVLLISIVLSISICCLLVMTLYMKNSRTNLFIIYKVIMNSNTFATIINTMSKCGFFFLSFCGRHFRS
jgi:hypothetical protein